jgi:hypothetical protein
VTPRTARPKITADDIDWDEPPAASLESATKAIDRIEAVGLTDTNEILEHVRAYLMPILRRLDALAQGTVIADAERRLPGVTAEGLRAKLREHSEILAGITGPTESRWPEPMSDAAMHGLAGDFVRAVEPHSESDPAALLTGLLAVAGNIVGPDSYLPIEADKHPARIFRVLVGGTASGRKGTSERYTTNTGESADPSWINCVQSGLSSGEGLIHGVRDPVVEGDGDDFRVLDAGVSDKRLMVVASEFASTLRVLGRDGNTLSPTIRDSWDSGRLQVMTKRSPARATGAHVSIMGHITKAELRRYLTSTEAGNGFANRFLWVCVKRSKCLPFGGNVDQGELDAIASRLRAAVRKARGIGEMSWAPETRLAYAAVYPDLTADRPGLFGAVTARAAANVVRLAVTFALLDGDAEIKPVHLQAAVAVWEYCEASALYIFGDSLGDPVADAILSALEGSPKGMTRTAVSRLFSGNKTKDEIDMALRALQQLGRVAVDRVGTDGRPAETWRLQ